MRKEGGTVNFSWKKGQQGKFCRERDTRAGQLRMSMILFVREKRSDGHSSRGTRISRDNVSDR